MNRIGFALALLFIVHTVVLGAPSSADYSMSVLPLDSVTAVNGSGLVIGSLGGKPAYFQIGGGSVATVLRADTFTSAVATAIASNGYIVGYGFRDGLQYGLFWTSLGGTPTAIAPPNGYFAVIPTGVNKDGMIVGHISTNPNDYYYSTAFYWTPLWGLSQIAPSTQDSRLYEFATSITDNYYISGVAGKLFTNPNFPDSHYEGAAAFRWLAFTNDVELLGLSGSSKGQRALSNGSILGEMSGVPHLWTYPSNIQYRLVDDQTNTYTLVDIGTAGRIVGNTTVQQTPYPTFAFTMESPISARTILPVPVGASSSAVGVTSCGTVVGGVRLASGVAQRVMWQRSTCDTSFSVTTPNMRGFTADQAISGARQAALFLGGLYYESGPCNYIGLVNTQSPTAGSSREQGSLINVTIPWYCIVPDVVGSTVIGARAQLTAAGLTPGSTSTIKDSCNVGLVVRQSPAANAILYGTTSVSMVIGANDPKHPCP